MSYYDRDRRPFVENGIDKYTAGQMNHTYSHHSNTSEYQSSGVPFVAAKTVGVATTTVNFPYVTRWVMVNVYSTSAGPATAKEAYVSFGSGGYAADAKVSTYLCGRQRLEIKCKKLIITTVGVGNTIEVIAGLTGVKDFPNQDVTRVSGITSITQDGSDGDGNPITFSIFS